ncbi:electron transfer flavoprotein subunit alpha/FixB family protein [Luteibaculum oceani]|uniref:Electron transfer flavoprotein subunit alpha/FixB family protein n=1 Tax=Luteibaculum oceani TaxID=1294296 RepID=A0A5C6UZI2_9FLAO|nr:electron transfer flavoprotein subunit alpha/FixB family protein [Luteibaculum oceani]TXC78319.1 electron transfer flavoprotein subunit alpha/FixB family protein [Luteibaculum oceani]
MSVLVFVETLEGKIQKNAYEAVFYGNKIAGGSGVTVLTFGDASNDDLAALGNYGATKVKVARAIKTLDTLALTKFIEEEVNAGGHDVAVFSFDPAGKMVAPVAAAKLKAGLVAGAIDLPDTSDGFVVKKNVFSGKAFAFQQIHTDKKFISILPNSFKPEKGSATAEVEEVSTDFNSGKVRSKGVSRASTDRAPLPEAELVVSAGRGLKGPENWGMVEELADVLEATTACSRPVADIGWRPHHEHVGQTGIAIRPNLYIAIGISGAIQHLAGVNGSKVIVVINNDPEAPFFKAADYGIVGDAFEVVPKLVEAFKAHKANQ